MDVSNTRASAATNPTEREDGDESPRRRPIMTYALWIVQGGCSRSSLSKRARNPGPAGAAVCKVAARYFLAAQTHPSRAVFRVQEG